MTPTEQTRREAEHAAARELAASARSETQQVSQRLDQYERRLAEITEQRDGLRADLDAAHREEVTTGTPTETASRIRTQLRGIESEREELEEKRRAASRVLHQEMSPRNSETFRQEMNAATALRREPAEQAFRAIDEILRELEVAWIAGGHEAQTLKQQGDDWGENTLREAKHQIGLVARDGQSPYVATFPHVLPEDA